MRWILKLKGSSRVYTIIGITKDHIGVWLKYETRDNSSKSLLYAREKIKLFKLIKE